MRPTTPIAIALLFTLAISACEESEPRGRSTAVVSKCRFRVKVMSFDGPARADVLGKVYPVDPEHPRILQFPVHILGDDVDGESFDDFFKLKKAATRRRRPRVDDELYFL